MKLKQRFERIIIPKVEKRLAEENELLFDLETLRKVHGKQIPYIDSMVTHSQQSIGVLETRLKEYKSVIEKLT